LVLAFFVLRKPDVPLPRIILLFVAFIFACGFGHLLEAVIFWHPVYRLAGVWKLVTALVSWTTVVAVFVSVPYALKLPGLARLNDELSHSNTELQTLTDRLQDRTASLQVEVAERIKAEAKLAEHARELEQFNRLVVSRELRMIELKREVNELARLNGQQERYQIDRLDGDAQQAIAVYEEAPDETSQSGSGRVER
jgi:hypothetical protein